MDENISKFQEIQILLAFIRRADEKGSVDFDKMEIDGDLREIVGNVNWTDSFLYKLNVAGVLRYEEIGEDGFKPIVIASVSAHTHEYLAELIASEKQEQETLIESVKQESEELKARITEILTFDPGLLLRKISETQSKIDDVSKHIKGNELLKPIEKPLNDIRRHFESVNRVALNYEDIYKNIIRPVQEEGRSGVKATVKWAILSIILSTCISIIISNWSKVSALFAGA